MYQQQQPNSSTPTPTLAFSALYNFTVAQVYTVTGRGGRADGAADPVGEGAPPVPPASAGVLGMSTKKAAFPTSAVLLVRPGFVRANRGYGSVMRQYHRTFRRRSLQTDGLSYWNDNQAGYSWWSVGPVCLTTLSPRTPPSRESARGH